MGVPVRIARMRRRRRPKCGTRPALRYTPSMRSVADDFRAESRADMALRSPAERVELALALGDADVTLLCAARGISQDEAVQVIKRSRQHGRRRSISSRGGQP